MNYVNLIKPMVPGHIRVRAEKSSVILSDGRWTANIDVDGLSGLSVEQRTEALRAQVEEGLKAMRAAGGA